MVVGQGSEKVMDREFSGASRRNSRKHRNKCNPVEIIQEKNDRDAENVYIYRGGKSAGSGLQTPAPLGRQNVLFWQPRPRGGRPRFVCGAEQAPQVAPPLGLTPHLCCLAAVLFADLEAAALWGEATGLQKVLDPVSLN